MEPVLAKQSVEIKCSICASILMGNYEFYYAAGKLCSLAGEQPVQPILPKELHAFIQPLLLSYQPRNEQESYLVKLLKEYKVSDEYDDQMELLLHFTQNS